MSVHVGLSDAHVVGGCNACASRSKAVYVLRGRTSEFRLCAGCMAVVRSHPKPPPAAVSEEEAERFRRMLPLGACAYISTEQMQITLQAFIRGDMV